MFGVFPFGVPYFAQPTLEVVPFFGPAEIDLEGAGELDAEVLVGAGELSVSLDGAFQTAAVAGATVSSVSLSGSRK